MGEAVDRLEVAGETELVALAAFSLRGVFVKKKRWGKIHHVHGAPASLRFFITDKRKASMPYAASR
jgi:hypothetical protein